MDNTTLKPGTLLVCKKPFMVFLAGNIKTISERHMIAGGDVILIIDNTDDKWTGDFNAITKHGNTHFNEIFHDGDYTKVEYLPDK
jgi:hypothetical protein